MATQKVFGQIGLGKQCWPRSDCSSRSSLIRVYTVWNSIGIFLMHYSAVKLLCLNIMVITANFSGVWIFWNFVVFWFICFSHDGPVWQLAWAHPMYGNMIASCGYDRKVIIWKETNGTWGKLYEYSNHDSSGELAKSSFIYFLTKQNIRKQIFKEKIFYR